MEKPKIRKAFGIELDPDPQDKITMTEIEQQVHLSFMEELQKEWENNSKIHKERRFANRGVRSSQISALVALLIKKGVLE